MDFPETAPDKVWSNGTMSSWVEQCPVSPDNVRLGMSVVI
jgi:hypothetical protein